LTDESVNARDEVEEKINGQFQNDLHRVKREVAEIVDQINDMTV